MSFTAKDVQNLRQASGAGMMDAKRALEETDGDFDAAAKLLREKGLAKSVDRADRENTQGVVAVGVRARAWPPSSSSSARRTSWPRTPSSSPPPSSSPTRSPPAAPSTTTRTSSTTSRSPSRRTSRSAASSASRSPTARPVDIYLHKQDGRGVNAVIVVLDGGDAELAHEVAVSAAFSKPKYLTRDEVPQADAAEERATLEGITRAEGKPEQAIEKIVEGRLNAWYKNQVLLEQPYAKDDKQSITQLLGDAKLARFAQVYIGS